MMVCNIVLLYSNFVLVLHWNITYRTILSQVQFVSVHNRCQMALDKTERSLAGYIEDRRQCYRGYATTIAKSPNWYLQRGDTHSLKVLVP